MQSLTEYVKWLGRFSFRELPMCEIESKRFGSLRITDYDDVLEPETPLQFSAVTFRRDDDDSGFEAVLVRMFHASDVTRKIMRDLPAQAIALLRHPHAAETV